MQHEAYVWAEVAYRQNQLLAEAERHRRANQVRKDRARGRSGRTGQKARGRLASAVAGWVH